MADKTVKTLALLLLGAILGCGSGGCAPSPKTQTRIRVAVVPKRESNEYWDVLHAGALGGVRQLREKGVLVDLVWAGTETEGDNAGQIRLIERFAREHVDALIVSPQNRDLMAAAVNKAIQSGVPVIAFDSEVNTPMVSCYVGTDNYSAGEKAAEHIAGLLKGKGRVLMQRYLPGSGSSMEREAGFANALRANHREVTALPWNTYAGATREEALNVCRQALKKWGSQADAILVSTQFAGNEMLRAMMEAGLAGRIPLVVFDTNPFLVSALHDGKVQALVVQSEWEMGRKAVEIASQCVLGHAVARVQHTPVTVVTRDLMKDPAMHALIEPPVAHPSMLKSVSDLLRLQ
ncbi:MAG: substrate-binding domain-containing protein [Verrucomicrobiae bacterium]|nr:substrate-binding domain-containing protein [Verrucomicrobiae bacterium]